MEMNGSRAYLCGGDGDHQIREEKLFSGKLCEPKKNGLNQIHDSTIALILIDCKLRLVNGASKLVKKAQKNVINTAYRVLFVAGTARIVVIGRGQGTAHDLHSHSLCSCL